MKKQKLQLRKVKVNGKIAYKLYNTDTGALYRTIYKTVGSAERKREIMKKFFLKKT